VDGDQKVGPTRGPPFIREAGTSSRSFPAGDRSFELIKRGGSKNRRLRIKRTFEPLMYACASCASRLILNYMVQYISPPLDLSFAALSDATRRGIIDQLGRGDASITSLADTFQMTLTGMKKHVQVLERAGLVVTQKVGRVRTCKLGKRGLKAEAEWIEAHRKLFEARFEALDEIISEMQKEGSDESAS